MFSTWLSPMPPYQAHPNTYSPSGITVGILTWVEWKPLLLSTPTSETPSTGSKSLPSAILSLAPQQEKWKAFRVCTSISIISPGGTMVTLKNPPGPWLLRWYLTVIVWPRRNVAVTELGGEFGSHGPGQVLLSPPSWGQVSVCAGRGLVSCPWLHASGSTANKIKQWVHILMKRRKEEAEKKWINFCRRSDHRQAGSLYRQKQDDSWKAITLVSSK